LSTEEGEPRRANRSATTPIGSERPGGILAQRAAWERAHLARIRNPDNHYLVRATATGYYNHRLYREGDEFKMAIDPKLEPPRWVVLIKRPRGRVLGVPTKGGGIERIEELPSEDSLDMPMDGRGSAVKARQRQLELEEEMEERSIRRRKKAAKRRSEEDEDDED
jgi:hypothetical protein